VQGGHVKLSTNTKAFKLEGVPELQKTLKEISKTLNAQGQQDLVADLKAAVLKPAMIVRDEARDLVPVVTGNLRDAIFAGPGRMDLPDALVGVNQEKAPYARYVEYGTSKMIAHPYFRPAITATRPLVANIMAEDLSRVVAKTADRFAFHPPVQAPGQAMSK
jgi:HK97 gp10 family phage protein